MVLGHLHIQKNEVPIHATTWVNFENMIPFIRNMQNRRSIETEADQWLPKAGESWGKWEMTANGYGVSFKDNENVLKL